MRWRPVRVVAWAGVGVLVLAGAALLVLTNSDWGRERVRVGVLRALDGAARGEVSIARVEGNLLSRVRVIDVSIVDEQGRPFVRADTVSTRFSILALLFRRIQLRDARLVRAEVVLDKPPDEDWNFTRVFPTDPEPRDPRPRGWGHWIGLEDVELVQSRLTVRSAWEPGEDLTRAEREEALRRALSPETRENVVPVPGGYQNVMDFRQLDALVSRVLVAHPDTAALPIDVERLRGVLEPYRPPAAVVHDLAGEFRIVRDSLFMRDVRAVLPGSRVAGEGVYDLDSGDLLLRLEGAPVALADLRWLHPPLPREGGGPLRLELRRRTLTTRIVVTDADLQVRESRLAGRIDLTVGDTVRLQDTALRFRRLDTRLVEDVFADVDLPRHGRVTGHAFLEGTPGALRLDGDVTFEDAVAGISRVIAVGDVDVEDGVRFGDLEMRFAPLQAALVRAAEPRLPLRGTIEGTARLRGALRGILRVDGDLTLRDPRAPASRVRATGGLDTRPELRFVDLRVGADPLHLDILRGELPELPAGGTVAGEVLLNGVPARLLQVDGDLALRDPRSGLSRVAARGGIVTEAGLSFRRLALRLHPLQVALVESVGGPDLRVGGVVEGSAVLDGDPDARLAFEADLEHRVADERSHVAGEGEIFAGPERRVELDLRLLPLSLVTVGRLAPAAGLRGSAWGTLEARGVLGALQLRTELELPEGGGLSGSGTLDLASEAVGYDLGLGLRRLDLAGVTTRSPATTDLSGSATVVGRGFELATMQARVTADLQGVQVGDVPADEVRLRLGIAAGLADVDSSLVRLNTARALLDGSFGLVADRSGVLGYDVQVDSLHVLAPWIPGADTAVVRPRPAVARAALEEAEERRARERRAAEVERLATGVAPPPPPDLDTLPPAGIPRDSLAGSVRAVGELSGNLERFDVEGSADLEEVVYQGSYVGRGRARYEARGVGAPATDLGLDASFASVLALGFAYDSVAVGGRYAGGRFGTGRVALTARQDEGADLEAAALFTLAEEMSELRLENVGIRVDTVTWRTPRPAVLRWRGEGAEVETLELLSDTGGRVFVDGRLPVEGPADLDVILEAVEIGHVSALLQADVEAAGLLHVDARLRGTRRSPTLDGEIALVDASLDGRSVPDARGEFAYAELELTAAIDLLEEERVLAAAEGRLPLDLSLVSVPGSRLLNGPLLVDVRADSLPLEGLSALTDQVDEVEGVARGEFSVRGTFDEPVLEGLVDVDAAAARVVALGVRFREGAGRFRMDGSTLTVDSLLARSRGPVRVDGSLDLSDPSQPAFDLAVDARDARVLDNEHGRLDVDADLEVSGPFDAVVVTGQVRTRRGVIYVPELSELGGTDVVALDEPRTFERLDTLLLARRDLLLPPHPLLENIEVDVGVRVERDVWLRSIEANVEIYTPPEVGDVRVRMIGWERQLLLEGTVNADRGEYEFMSRRFRLTRGAVTFLGDPDLDAIVQVAAEHEVAVPGRQPFTIRALLGGTLREPTVTLESNAQPPISQTDLMTYLALGRHAASLLPIHGSALSGPGPASGQLSGNVAALATQQLASAAVGTLATELEGDAARALGVDVFRITPADFPDELFTGRFIDLVRATEIEIGSYVTPRLFASAQGRATFSRPGARVEYATRGGFRWTASWQPVYMPRQPTLAVREPVRRSVAAFFLFREWRY